MYVCKYYMYVEFMAVTLNMCYLRKRILFLAAPKHNYSYHKARFSWHAIAISVFAQRMLFAKF